MPKPPIMLVENLFDRGLYPTHLVTASAEASGFPVYRISDARRDETRWKATTANQEATITLDCGRVRAASAIFMDRGHNLAGKRWLLEISADNFATTVQTVLDVNPHPANAGGLLTDLLGAVVLDGSWGKILDGTYLSRYWRIRIPAASGFIPEITGLYLGKHFQLQRSVPMPYSEYGSERFFTELVSVAGRVGRSRTYRRRGGQLVIRAASDAEYYETLRLWLEDVYRDRSQPSWLVLDADFPAETTVNVLCPEDNWTFELDRSQWPYPVATVPWMENTPEVR
ncbi:MAG: hypothetical protein KatS3mg109_1222 [Pirellulaceae bacterium]|nr:MAG: hypothetical protein KatS3mg109_0369 [Pirellulaceae bacterium]GIW90790.1 MAG: hypothetical protein KatS3mg109_1222 [Pirellulaceae bacterium]